MLVLGGHKIVHAGSMTGALGVRKGAWTEEEDNLLRKCIEKYGEGRWHQVPVRAGLNRCRKSCRLRWLNYLKPNIKRGEFTYDEVDLMIRLHKLLGNRWTLIAGRLPGRTANDVKNYWNMHLRKKTFSCKKDVKAKTEQETETKIIKPRARSFSNNLCWSMPRTAVENEFQLNDNFCKPSTALPSSDNDCMWWESLLNDENSQTSTKAKRETQEEPITTLFNEETAKKTKVGDIFSDEDQSFWNDLSFDGDLWNLFNTEI